jgi:hypothetical protein
MSIDVLHLSGDHEVLIESLSPEVLFDTFLLEAGRISEDSLRTQLSQNSPVFSARVFGDNPYVNFLNLRDQHIPELQPISLSKTQAMIDSAQLRHFLGPALGLTNTSKLISISPFFFFSLHVQYIYIFDLSGFILKQKYVLTPDFAAKLLVVHERLKAGKAVILSGDTVSNSNNNELIYNILF